jgi:predicted dinucleotide-binding enzyme
MKIAVIGAGNGGKALRKAWARRDHDVTYGLRRPDDPQIPRAEDSGHRRGGAGGGSISR